MTTGDCICQPFRAVRRRLSFILIAAVVLAGSLPAAAQKFLPKTIQFNGDPEYSSEELLAAAGLKVGVAFSSVELNDHAKQLMDTGVFDNITFKFDSGNLVYSLTPTALLYPIRLENFPFAQGKDLEAKLHDRFPLYHGKVPPDGGLEEGVRGALEELFAADGIKAIVTTAPYNDVKRHKITGVSYTIVTPPVQIGEIRLDSVSPPLEPKAQEIMAQQSGSAYDLEGSPSQIAVNLGNFYREKGYLEAAVQPIPQPTPTVTPEAIGIPFVVSFSPGPLYKIARVQLAPGLAVTQAEFDHQSGIHPGDIADSVHLRQNWEFIARQYHNRGYMRAAVVPTPSFVRSQAMVSYTVTVAPGPVYTMGYLTIQNAADDLHAAMLAAWKMPSGGVFDEGAVRGFFATHDVDPALERVFATINFSYSLHLNDATRTVDVVLRLEKRH
jgi:outer membrane protein assembly factor BamA